MRTRKSDIKECYKSGDFVRKLDIEEIPYNFSIPGYYPTSCDKLESKDNAFIKIRINKHGEHSTHTLFFGDFNLVHEDFFATKNRDPLNTAWQNFMANKFGEKYKNELEKFKEGNKDFQL